jgi:hypothetical protein
MASFGGKELQTSRLSVKFLLSNGLTGSLIGSGGSAIKELVSCSCVRMRVRFIYDVLELLLRRINLPIQNLRMFVKR